MPPKQTPYQFSKSLVYDKGELPKFLQNINVPGYTTEDKRLNQSRANKSDEESEGWNTEDELFEGKDEERPQIVVLKNKHMSEKEVKKHFGRQDEDFADSSKVEQNSEEDEPPPADGRILFRRPKKNKPDTSPKSKSTLGKEKKKPEESNSLTDLVDQAVAERKKRKEGEDGRERSAKKKKAKKANVASLLSFDAE
ncbi:uncharacterized protein VTP21DRAFT_11610 [Calcarisporiella thermophila]|uniref:uncharacterized protein n=1 Tax=Calcarisporiella thermophila TaxID=911321 RepID=UPI0037434487